MNRILLLCLLTVGLSNAGNGAVNLVDNGGTRVAPIDEELTVEEKRSRKISPATTEQIKQLQINGYIDRKYVRLVVDIVNDKQLSGYLFEKKGSKKYVYGEKVDGVLHVYDPKGRHLTVILDK